jgi:hypothetical protein
MSKFPQELSPSDWEEVRQIEEVATAWGLTYLDGADALRTVAYAVKFRFEPQTMPNYCGDVMIVFGDSLEPIVLVRKGDGQLCPAFPLVQRPKASSKRIFVTVSGGVAEVDSDTVPDGTTVEVIDL